jgi:hypothetical protein
MNNTFSIIPLSIEARGEVISSNIDEFRDLVREALGMINLDLQTDEQFGQAELDAKALKEAEGAVKSAKDKALADAESLHALFVAMDEASEEIRKARLDLETQIKKRKEEIKTEIVEEYLAAFDIDPRDARKHFLTSLQNAIKGKRTVESMRTACRVYQTTQQAMIIQSRASVERFVGKFGPELVMDRRELELKNVEAVEAELVRRIEAKKAADEAAKLKAEADAAKADAAKAQAALAEANKPPAAPVTAPPSNVEQGPWKQEGTSVAVAEPVTSTELHNQDINAEWKEFKSACLAAFVPLKAAKAKLKHSKNSAKAQVFANAINAAWQEVVS